ncbi:MAG: ATP-dependent sacrificial sulfur transferase LarE [Magnetococcales bacterium]|nr:ATP-dependent sacrificial sulfur transferase LarE [Magnetococcales bacterium]
MAEVQQKYQDLLNHLRTLGRVVVAWSGGVDSTFLVAAVMESGIDYLAVTATSPTMPAHDLAEVKRGAAARRINHRIIESGEMSDDNFVKNPPDRCFYCKSDLFGRLTRLAEAEGFDGVLDGSSADDIDDYRPGFKAKDQFRVLSPLLDMGLTKAEIRAFSKQLDLPTWDKPASPCLSSRIAYGDPIELAALRMVEQAEIHLKELGFTTLRVRKQGETARIELLEGEMDRFFEGDLRRQVSATLQGFGFRFVTLDLEGFMSGKLNRVIDIPVEPSAP